jgi:hypothetical protein
MSEASPNSPSQSQAVESSPSLPPKVQPQQGRLARLIRIAFIGSGGIRAGWRLAVFLVIVIGLIVGLSFTARRFNARVSRSDARRSDKLWINSLPEVQSGKTVTNSLSKPRWREPVRRN